MTLPEIDNEASENSQDRESPLERLVREHARFLFRVASSVLRNAHDAEDAVQDALVKLVRMGELPQLENERAYLARAVYRAALDRQNMRRPGHDGDPAVMLQLADSRRSPEAAAAEIDERALLAQFIEELPAELRQPLLLSAIEGLNSREAGEILGVPEATVRTRLHRARNELRARFVQITHRRGRPEVAARTGEGKLR